MPNKTIYIKESDVALWESAQKQLGESLSSIFIDCLKERLQSEPSRKAKLGGVEGMKAILAEINATLNLDIELHPFWKYPILDQNTINHGYKLHLKGANPDRVMSLVIWPLDYDNPATKTRIKKEIRAFWSGNETAPHRFVDTTK